MATDRTAPQNRALTGRDAQGRFQRGVTGNAGGRPKSMVAAILERRPEVSTELVDLWSLVAFGAPKAVEERLGVVPSTRDRLAAAAELADRLHGRAVQADENDDERITVPVFLVDRRVNTK